MDDNVIILGKRAEDWRRDFWRVFRSGGIAAAVLAAIFLAVAGRPYYTVGPTEQGVVLRFGRHVRTSPPGLHGKWPWPIETVQITDTQVRRISIGFKSPDQGTRFRNQYGQVETKAPTHDESLMLTGDENIIMVELSIQYRVKDPVAYLFNAKEADDTLKDIGEATLRRVIGDYGVDAPLTSGKAEIEDEILTQAQALSDRYGLGLMLTAVNLQDVQAPVEVQPSFKAVVTAKENKQKYINESLGYQNGQIPRAEGKAAGVINQASAYARGRVLKAQGEIARFSAILTEYRKTKEVTRDRLYLETLEKVLERVNATIIDRKIGGLPIFDLSGGMANLLDHTPPPEQKQTETTPEGGTQP
jgi:membrane protease subunit HflK